MKILYTPLQKIWSGMTIALMIVNPLFTFVPVAYADEAEQPEVVTDQIVEPAVEDQVEETPAPSETPIVEPAETPVAQTPVLVEETPVPEATPAVAEELPAIEESVWQILPNGKALTRGAVSMDQTYVAPQNSEVKVRFTELPDTPGNLTIQEIKLTAEEQKELGALTDTVYDISSSMENGSFAYTLTLPKPENSKDVMVKYAETRNELDTAKEVTQKIQEGSTSITVTNLDHFTVFIISADTSTTGGTGAYTAITGPTLVESALGQIGVGTIVLNAPAGFQFRTTPLSVTATVTTSGLCLLNQTKLAVPFLPQVVTPTASTITISVSSASALNAGCKSTITWTGIRVRPINGSPLAVGPLTLTGTASVAGATFSGDTLQEVAGAVHNASSSLVASPTSVAANGITTSTITATVRDQFNNPISGQNVTLAKTSGSGSPVITSSPAVTNASGQATFTVKSTTVASNVFTASNGGAYSKNVTVTFTDATKPVITLLGTNPVSVEVGNPYVDAGATALDNVDGNITGNIITTGLPVDTSAVGSTTVTYSVSDIAGNVALPVNRTVNIVDTTAPVIEAHSNITVEATSSAGATVNYTSPATSDFVDGPGVATCSPISGTTFPIGTTVVTCNATDAHGNSAIATTFQVIVEDTTAPTTTSSGIDGDWHKLDVEVTLSCSDLLGSGCATTYYTTDGTPPTTLSSSYVGPFTLATTGQYPIQYFSVDNKGNAEAVKNGGTVKIDKLSPSVPVIGAMMSPTNNPVVEWAWNAVTEIHSGLLNYTWGIQDSASMITDSGTTAGLSITRTLADGVWTFLLKAVDNVGNETAFLDAMSQVTVDTTAPSIPSATPIGGDYLSDPTVSLISTDNLTNYTIYYTLDGSLPKNTSTQYTIPFIVDHSLTLKAIAIDGAGNKSPVMTELYAIAPVISDQSVFSSATNNPSQERLIQWTTDDPSTSRVVFGKKSVTTAEATLAGSPNYGYERSSDLLNVAPDKTINHSVLIGGLDSNTTYYYRVISAGSPETLGEEHSFGTEPTQGTGGGSSGDSENSTSSSTSTTSSSQGRVLGAKTSGNSGGGSSQGTYAGSPFVLGSMVRNVIARSVDTTIVTTVSASPTPSVSPEPSPFISPEAIETPTVDEAQDTPMQWSWWYLLLIAIAGAVIWYFMRNRTPSV